MRAPAHRTITRFTELWPTVVLLCLLVQSPTAIAQQPIGEWRAYAGDSHSTKYSPLDQINADNIADLQVAWAWDAAALDAATGESPRGFRSTPLKVIRR